MRHVVGNRPQHRYGSHTMMPIGYQPHTRHGPITAPWEPLFAREMAERCTASGWSRPSEQKRELNTVLL